MKFLVLCAALIATLQTATAGWIDGPNGKSYINLNRWFKTKDASRQLCEEAGGFLPQPMNHEENEFLKKMANTLYLGLNDILSEGVWVWEKRPSKIQWSDWIHWKSGRKEPDGGSNQNCAILQSEGWSDVPCIGNNAETVICERNEKKDTRIFYAHEKNKCKYWYEVQCLKGMKWSQDQKRCVSLAQGESCPKNYH